MVLFFGLAFVLGVLVVAYFQGAGRVSRSLERSRFIDSYPFPRTILQRVRQHYPQLDEDQLLVVEKGLKDYFHITNMAGSRMVSMPSQVVDLAWHEFILFTREYSEFCGKAFARFLHHTPAEAMRTPTSAQDGIKTTWRLACKRENIDPNSPTALPLLFSIDGLLGIPDGFNYTLNCMAGPNQRYCASHIGCGAGCGSGSESGHGHSSHADIGEGDSGSGADSGGDGGGGDGGGCGGGGCGGGGD